MRMNMKKPAPVVKNHAGRKKNRTKGSSFKQSPFINLKEDVNKVSPDNNRASQVDRGDAPHMGEIMGRLMEMIFDINNEVITYEAVDAFIDTVYVYDPKRVEIVFRFEDELGKFLQQLQMQ